MSEDYDLPLPHRAVFPSDTARYFKECFGKKDFDRLAQALLTPPKYTALRVSRGYAIDTVLSSLDDALNDFNSRVTKSGRKPVKATKHPILNDIVLVPSVDAQESFPVKSTLPGYRCIIDRRCAEAVLRGSDIYAKGILSLSKGCNKIGKTVTILATLATKKIPRGTPVNVFLRTSPVVFIGVGELKMVRNAVLSGMPDGLAVIVNQRWKRDAPSMNGVIASKVFMQNLPSACVPHALDPRENDTIIDLCAAPGGKTTHIAQLMNNKGLVVALDRSYKKVKKIKSLCRRLKISIVKAFYADSTQVILPEKGDSTNTCCSNECGNTPSNSCEDGSSGAKSLVKYNLAKQQILGDEKRIGLSMALKILEGNGTSSRKAQNETAPPPQMNQPMNKIESMYEMRDIDAIIEDAARREVLLLKEKRSYQKCNDFEQTLDDIVVPIHGFPVESFDKVLLDGPCSALGLRPRLEQNMTFEYLKGIQKQQLSLFFSAFYLLKPGGTMVYSTCTFNPMENECVIAQVLKQYSLEVIALPAPVDQIGVGGMEGFGLSPNQCKLVRRFNPHSDFDTIGFFIARLRKLSSARKD